MSTQDITPWLPVFNVARSVSKPTLDAPLNLTGLTAFKGRYEFLCVLGSGGMGVVYKARQVMLNKLVAIKMLHPRGFSDQALKRFDREARAARSLLHPNLITIRDYGVADEGQPYMIFDYIDGTTLAETIRVNGQLDLDLALDIFIQVAKGLSYAHQQGVLHRDIKPGNIIIPRHQVEVKIVDFGIAKVLGDVEGQTLTQTGEIFGTPLYMSPEQGAGKTLDARSDLYSMGCVMFEALTAMPPFVGDSAIMTIIKHQNEDPTSLKEASLGKEFPLAVEQVVAKLLAKDPELRYQSAKELIDDLTAIRFSQVTDLTQIKPQSKAESKNVVALSILCLVTAAAIIIMTNLCINERRAFANRPDPAATNTVAPVPSPTSTEVTIKVAKDAADELESEFSTFPTQGFVQAEPIQTDSAAAQEIKLTAATSSLKPDSDVKPATQKIASLTTGLDLSGEMITPQLMKEIAEYHKLRELVLRNGKFVDEPLRFLKNDVASIDFTGSNVSDQDLQYLRIGSFPEELTFDHTDVGDQGMKGLVLESALVKVLSLNYTKVTDQGLSILGEKFNLKTLRVEGDKISDRGLKAMYWFKNLEELDLQGVTGPITETGIGYLAEHKRLKKISISDLALIASLTQIPQLQEVVVAADNVSEEQLRPLKHLPELSRLTIYTNHKGNLERLKKDLPHCDVQMKSSTRAD